MAGLIVIFVLSGLCLGGWQVHSRRRRFKYRKMDVELAALRRAILEEAAE